MNAPRITSTPNRATNLITFAICALVAILALPSHAHADRAIASVNPAFTLNNTFPEPPDVFRHCGGR